MLRFFFLLHEITFFQLLSFEFCSLVAINWLHVVFWFKSCFFFFFIYIYLFSATEIIDSFNLYYKRKKFSSTCPYIYLFGLLYGSSSNLLMEREYFFEYIFDFFYKHYLFIYLFVCVWNLVVENGNRGGFYIFSWCCNIILNGKIIVYFNF